jgi:putative nucleotidyltransferase with HDIG domain
MRGSLRVEEALVLLESSGAPGHLVRHARLVLEVADALCGVLLPFAPGLLVDEIRVGAVLHDIGKILHPEELHQKGRLHEEAGRELSLSLGVPPVFAEHCVAHGTWKDPGRTLEQLVVALADKLWKGKRVEVLEARVIEMLSGDGEGLDWSLLVELDGAFEAIASAGSKRLERSLGG